MGPIRGQTRPLPVEAGITPEVQHLGAKLNASIHNRFDVEVIDATTGEIKYKAVAKNVICNRFWSMITSYDGCTSYIHYGSGSGTPAVTDASLFTFIAAAPATETTRDVNFDSGVYHYQKKIQLNPSTANGKTITEVGFGYSSNASSLVTHAMLKDMNGNQISITKTATDIINIYATIYLHWTEAAIESGINVLRWSSAVLGVLSGRGGNQPAAMYPVNYKGVGRYYINGYDVGASTAYGTGQFGDVVMGTVSGNSSAKTITITFNQIAANNTTYNGYNGIAAIFIMPKAGDYGSYSESIYQIVAGTDALPATTITAEAIGTGDGATKDFSTKFPYVHDATIFVNGVQDSTVTVEKLPPSMSLGLEFICMDANKKANVAGVLPPTGYDSYNHCAEKGGTAYYENPWCETIGVASFNSGSDTKYYVSNDFLEWIEVTTPVAAAYRKYRYWKIVGTNASSYPTFYNVRADRTNMKNIHFSTPPATGAVITSSYITDTVAKSETNLFDFSITFHLGEHTT